MLVLLHMMPHGIWICPIGSKNECCPQEPPTSVYGVYSSDISLECRNGKHRRHDKGELFRMSDSEVIVNVKKLRPDAQIPKTAKSGDVAFDIFSAIDYDLEAGTRFAVPTGVAMEIPLGYEGQVRPRSGLAIRDGITTLNTPGTIDSGYRGEVKVILINHSDAAFHISKGMRIAQLAIRTVPKARFIEVDSLSDSERGEDGFGSTGV